MDLHPTKKTRGKRRRKVSRVIWIALAMGLLCYLLMLGWTVLKESTLPPKEPGDVILVLGAQVKEDGSLSVALERRLTLALAEYRAQPRPIITCGGQGSNEPAPEGDVMRAWLLSQGVPAEHVTPESASTSTRENLGFARQIMAERGFQTALVVTSDYHVARALSLCKQLGIQATGVGSESKPEYWLMNHTRESISWIKFWIEGQ